MSKNVVLAAVFGVAVGALLVSAGPAVVNSLSAEESKTPEMTAEQVKAQGEWYAKRNAEFDAISTNVLGFAKDVESKMPPRDKDVSALNWHNQFNEKCALTREIRIFTDMHDVFAKDYLECANFVENSAVAAHVQYDSQAVQSYIATINDYGQFRGGAKEHVVPTYKVQP